jgi:hypothetical protein
MKKLCILKQASLLCEVATGIHGTGFLLVLEMTSSFTCKDLHNNSAVSIIH